MNLPNTQATAPTHIPQRLLEDAELGQVAMRFVDRAGDVHPGIDDADKICADFYAAMTAVLNPRWEHRMKSAKAQPPIPAKVQTDLELEQLAAQAAGLQVEIITRNSGGSSLRITGVPLSERVYWTPLLDDGQAQRLAVQLRINLISTPAGAAVLGPIPIFVSTNGDCGGDCYAAARRAIVMAAAQQAPARSLQQITGA